MLPVEILPLQDSVVLRARGSELLILPHHVVQLKDKKDPRSFSEYFMRDALLNRPARKLFEAWLRKDGGLWRRVFDTVHEMKVSEDGGETETKASKTVKAPTEAKLSKPGKTAEVKTEAKADVKKDAKAPKAEVKTEAKKVAKKADEAPAKAAAKKPAKDAPKAAPKAAAKKEASAPKKAEKPAAKSEAKKDTKSAAKGKKGSKG